MAVRRASERSIIAFENFVSKYLDYRRAYERLEIEIPIISEDYSLISRCTLVFWSSSRTECNRSSVTIE